MFFLYVKMTNNYHQKHNEALKEAREDIKIFLKKKKRKNVSIIVIVIRILPKKKKKRKFSL